MQHVFTWTRGLRRSRGRLYVIALEIEAPLSSSLPSSVHQPPLVQYVNILVRTRIRAICTTRFQTCCSNEIYDTQTQSRPRASVPANRLTALAPTLQRLTRRYSFPIPFGDNNILFGYQTVPCRVLSCGGIQAPPRGRFGIYTLI
jgi:hypothetical protein